jgi:hypothetical protein
MRLPIAGSKTLKTAREWPQTLAAEVPGAPAEALRNGITPSTITGEWMRAA